jgi:hypothetical protein
MDGDSFFSCTNITIVSICFRVEAHLVGIKEFNDFDLNCTSVSTALPNSQLGLYRTCLHLQLV